jgi:Ca2+-transporting ATPase
MTAGDVVAELGVDPKRGLSSAEAARRLALCGPNALKTKRPVSLWRIFANQFLSPVVALLAFAVAVSIVAGKVEESLAIVAVLVINAAIGFFTEMRATRTMEALRAIGAVATRVRRDGMAIEIPAQDIVPGDIVLLEAGDVLTADLRLIDAHNLSSNEAALTGESAPVEKTLAPVAIETPLADRACLAFKGAEIVRGGGAGIVVGTGETSELGRISKLVETAKPERSPLEKQLDSLAGQLIWITIAMAAIIGATGVAMGRDVYLMVEAAIALAVAAIPEGLPIVATMALARGMWRMANNNALVERLATVETLGATTLICTDKTGTLTENRMSVARILTDEGEVAYDRETERFLADGAPIELGERPLLKETLVAGVLCNTADLASADRQDVGDPLEIALLHAGRAGGFSRAGCHAQRPHLSSVPFDADIKMMATAHARDGVVEFYVKGAPEAVIARCDRLARKEGTAPFSEAERAHWRLQAARLAGEGLRVIAAAKKRAASADEAAYGGLEFLGLFALLDPPRRDVRDAIAACHHAGVRIVMITGDHAATAKTIAAAIGLVGEDASVIEGAELKPADEMSETERRRVLDADIFARVTPAQKLDLVTIYQREGEVVAMTGDGVNDAPALRKADIGVAMGLRGAQIAREAAAMVLRDDAFATIVIAIREGRIILRNIQRFAAYLLSCNLAEVLIVSIAVVTGLPLPLLPLQILFLNLVTDVFPALALGVGAGDKGVLERPPRDPSKPIITRSLWDEIAGHGLSITAATLGAMLFASHRMGVEGSALITVSFLTLAFAQLWNVFNMRDPRAAIFINDVTRNPFVWAALAGCSVLLLAAVYIPALAGILSLTPPTAELWMLIAAASVTPALVGQIGKEIVREFFLRRRRRRKSL